MGNRNINELLERLAEAAAGSENNSTGTSGDQPVETNQSNGKSSGKLNAAVLREWMAEEAMYQQMIPPITTELLEKLDQIVSTLPDELLELKDKPYKRAQFARLIGSAHKADTGSHSNRNTEDRRSAFYEPTLEELSGYGISGTENDAEERVIVAGTVFAAMIAGVAIGGAIGTIMK